MSVYEEKPVQESLDGFWSGIIASDASALDDTVEVLIKAFSTQHRFGPCKWALNGSKMPERGNECIVVFDEKQRPVVMQWFPTDPTPETDTTIEVPIGGIVPYGGSSDPAGGKWLIANGREMSPRSGALWDVIGTSYGVGNGTTSYNLPNMKGKVPVGLDSGQIEFDALGETGGAKTHTLTSAQSGQKAVSTNANTVPQTFHPNTGLTGSGWNLQDISGTGSTQDSADSSHAHSISGSDAAQAHNNLQPYVVTNYIIRVL